MIEGLAMLTTFFVAPLFIFYRINTGAGVFSSILLSVPVFLVNVIITTNNYPVGLAINVIAIGFFLYQYSEKTNRPESYPEAHQTPTPEFEVLPEESKQGLIFINYTNIDEVTTERKIRVTNTSEYYIKGYCLLQHDLRTFRRDRINGDILDLATGELIDPLDYHFTYWEGR